MVPLVAFVSTYSNLGNEVTARKDLAQVATLETMGRDDRHILYRVGTMIECGEHGGDPASVAFCHQLGLDYVNCSPYRIPIARLAAAQAAIVTGQYMREGK